MLPIRSASIGEKWMEPVSFLKNPNQTKEAFDLYCKENPEYKLNKNTHAYDKTVIHSLLGNNKDCCNLVAHIIQREGKTVLDYGDIDGFTPLLSSIVSIIPEGDPCYVYRITHLEDFHPIHKQTMPNCDSIKAIAFFHMGANVNLTNSNPVTYVKCPIPKGATPLWLALEKTYNLDIVLMLLSCGANQNCELPLSENGQDMLKRAHSKISDLSIHFSAAQKNSDSLLNKIPHELVSTILSYNQPIMASEIVEKYANYSKVNNLPIQALFNIKS